VVCSHINGWQQLAGNCFEHLQDEICVMNVVDDGLGDSNASSL